jgi:3-methyladenine DNA glycosylase/8-oxoguanine DNA glycosylase
MSVIRTLGCLKRHRNEKPSFDEQDSSRDVSFQRAFDHRHLFTQSEKDTSKVPQLLEDMSSPFGLMEELFTEDPWRLLICTIFLNRTQRKMIDRTLYRFLRRWPTATDVISYASEDESLRDLIDMVAPLGLTHKRARGIVRFCKEFVSLMEAKRAEDEQESTSIGKLVLDRDDVTNLFFCGNYAADAYQIFIRKDVHTPVRSDDHALLAYTDWKRSV